MTEQEKLNRAVGAACKIFRESALLSQESLSHRTGLAARTILRLEQGYTLRSSTIAEVLEATDHTALELLEMAVAVLKDKKLSQKLVPA